MKHLLFIFSFLAITTMTFAQTKKQTKAEVLFFKADLSCCMKKSCDAFATKVEQIIKKNYPEGNVIYKEVRLSAKENEELVKKYNAVNETVIVVVTRRKKVIELDVTDMVAEYKKTDDADKFEKDFTAIINKNTKW
jgi:hypothetical protein